MQKRKLILPVFALIFIVFTVGHYLNQTGKLIRPKLLGVNKESSSLNEAVNQFLIGTKGTYAVVIKNMSDGESYSLNQDLVFEPGSLYKLWLMGAVFDKINKDEIKEDEILSEDVSVLNQKFEIDEKDAELKEGVVTLSVSNALNQMITISHNYAALLLLEKVGSSQIPSKVTAKDAAIFFENLYKGELVSKEYSQRMIDLLKNQKLNDGLPKYLPKDTQIAHKTGDIGWFKHDGGIIFTDKGDYIIVVLSESESPAGAQERIAKLSKAVYDYFTK